MNISNDFDSQQNDLPTKEFLIVKNPCKCDLVSPCNLHHRKKKVVLTVSESAM